MPTDSSDLMKQEHEEFALLYTAGPEEVRGNATEAYLEVYGCTRRAAESGGSRLLKRERVRARIRELRREAAEAAKDTLREWWELVPEAQETILEAARGAYTSDDDGGRVRLQAAREILDRAMGSPKQMHELDISAEQLVVRVAGAPHQPQEEYDPERAVEVQSEEVEEEDDPYAGLLEAAEASGLDVTP